MLKILVYNSDYDISRHIIRFVCGLWCDNEYPIIAAFMDNNRLFISHNSRKRNPFYHAEISLFYNLYKMYGVYEISDKIKRGQFIIGTKPCVFCRGIMNYCKVRRYCNLTKPNIYISHSRYIYFLKEFFKRKR